MEALTTTTGTGASAPRHGAMGTMLAIRKEQMAALETVTMRRFEDRVLRAIAKAFPERYERNDEASLRALVRAGVAKGEAYGITDDGDAERYILLLVEYGLDFEQEEERQTCRRLLEHKELLGDAKVSLVKRRLEDGPGGPARA